MTSAAEVRSQDLLLALAGPTAVGKSEVAIHLAQKLNGEIISVDSMQVYRGLDIGTAKPSPEQRARISHHLIDVVNLNSSFDAAQFRALAESAVERIRQRGRIPILCGGTGLYFKVLFEGLGEAPGMDEKLRSELETTPLLELLSELKDRDPATYKQIDRRNARRVVRAVEVIRLTRKPYSLQRAEWSQASPRQHQHARIFGLRRSPADLARRVDQRVEKMFEQGLVAETESLLKAGLGENRTALQALGYRQVLEYLRGLHSLAETIDLVKTRTRQFAKRQMTWFRRQLLVNWIDVAPTDEAAHIADEVVKRLAEATMIK
jgi:tRNA dimethylallyltransferase